MVIDTSALVSILRQEPDGVALYRILRSGFPRLLSAPTLVETSVVLLARFGESGITTLEAFVRETAIDVVPFTAEHAQFAADAFRVFGKGRHAAGLNFGDCFAYALAKATREPLLFKGNDFSLTDIQRAE